MPIVHITANDHAQYLTRSYTNSVLNTKPCHLPYP